MFFPYSINKNLRFTNPKMNGARNRCEVYLEDVTVVISCSFVSVAADRREEKGLTMIDKISFFSMQEKFAEEFSKAFRGFLGSISIREIRRLAGKKLWEQGGHLELEKEHTVFYPAPPNKKSEKV